MVMGRHGKLGPDLLRTGYGANWPRIVNHWTPMRDLPSKALEPQDSPSAACRHDTNKSFVN
jgi:hypothetical protein